MEKNVLTPPRRWIVVLWTAFGLALLSLLLATFSVEPAEVWATFYSAPVWLFAAATGLTLANQIIGALKWRVAGRFLAEPEAVSPDHRRMIALTTLGALFGQVIPLQVSTLLARWFLLSKEARTAGYAVRSTLFEQAFDLVFLIAGTFAAIAMLLADVPAAFSLLIMACVAALVVTAIRPILRLSCRIFQFAAGLRFGRGLFQSAADGFGRAASAPASVVLTLSAYSLARLIVVGLRAMIVFVVLAPGSDAMIILIVSPAIGLLTALPFAPAGLGVAEWSWSAVLIQNGVDGSTAALAALNLRLIAIASLLIILLGLAVTSILFRPHEPLKRPESG